MTRITRAALGAIAVLSLLAASSCAKPKPTLVRFEPYSAEALAAAKAKNVPAVVFGTASWCPPCQALHHGALAEASVKEALDALTRLEIDHSERGKESDEALDSHHISGIPCMVFFDAQGNEVARLVGPQPAEVIIAAAKKAKGV